MQPWCQRLKELCLHLSFAHGVHLTLILPSGVHQQHHPLNKTSSGFDSTLFITSRCCLDQFLWTIIVHDHHQSQLLALPGRRKYVFKFHPIHWETENLKCCCRLDFDLTDWRWLGLESRERSPNNCNFNTFILC